MKKHAFPSIQTELTKLKQQSMVSLNDVCVLDSLFEEKRQERKQQLTTDKTLTETIQWIGDDTNERQTDDISEQSEDSSDTNKVPQKKLKLI